MLPPAFPLSMVALCLLILRHQKKILPAHLSTPRSARLKWPPSRIWPNSRRFQRRDMNRKILVICVPHMTKAKNRGTIAEIKCVPKWAGERSENIRTFDRVGPLPFLVVGPFACLALKLPSESAQFTEGNRRTLIFGMPDFRVPYFYLWSLSNRDIGRCESSEPRFFCVGCLFSVSLLTKLALQTICNN